MYVCLFVCWFVLYAFINHRSDCNETLQSCCEHPHRKVYHQVTKWPVKKMMEITVEATILYGKFKGENVLLPRIQIIPTDMPFGLRTQTFAISCTTRFCNYHQQSTKTSLQVYGLNLENPCFSHWQLYVACSRVGKPSVLFVYTPEGKTKNIVYSKALNSINTIKTQ
jgi:hypothetical protein